MYRTSNPALGESAFQRMQASVGVGARTMTVGGTALKTLVLLIVATVSAAMVWSAYFGGNAEAAMGAVMVGAVGGLVLGLVTCFVPRLAPWTAPLYAVLEGMMLGGVSATFEQQYQGLPVQAVGLTFGTLFVLLACYATGIVRATDRFRAWITAATLGIAVYYLIAFVGGFFGMRMPLIHDNGWMGIGFSLVVTAVAALNYVLDFDFVERGVKAGADKRMEWYGAFGILVTTVWLYIELLRLLSKLRSRD
ncbi:MAG TPA: Bax inhibitor-1/YccA family protein [Longimicrobiaceae bacterium]